MPNTTPNKFNTVRMTTAPTASQTECLGVPAEQCDRVVAKGIGHGADAAGQDDGQLGPAEQKADPASEGPRQVHIIAAHPRIRRRQLGIAQGAEQRQDAAQKPTAEPQPRSVHVGEDVLGRLENRRPDDDADDNADGIPQSEMGVGRIAVGTLLVRVGHQRVSGGRKEAAIEDRF